MILRLYIAEKPSLATAIAHGLGEGPKKEGFFFLNGGQDIVTWCFGHILEQFKPDEYDDKYKQRWAMEDLPIIPSPWKLKVSDNCKKQFKIIKDLIDKADEIVNAGDPDREGQLLIDEVLEYVHNQKPVKRILLNALDDVSVKQALNDLRDNRDFIGLKNSALARSHADWLIGMNLSRAYTIKARQAGYGSAVSVGRVQTPTMALVVRRENEINNFHPVTYYQVQIDWQHENGLIPTTWQPQDNVNGLDSEGRLLDRSTADSLFSKIKTVAGYSKAKISNVEQKNKQEAQRLPYSLSALQIDAGKRFGYSPQEVLDVMQELYEKKLTTYPRSDCDYLPENQFAEVSEILAHLKNITKNDFNLLVERANISIKSRAWNDKKISAHHAIIPTRMNCDINSLSESQQNLYYMVAQAYLAQFFEAHKCLSTKVWVTCSDEIFTATGKTILDIGWKIIYENKNQREVNKEDEVTLPKVQEMDVVNFINGNTIEKVTKPPTRFNPSTLLKAMKEIYKYVKDANLKAGLKECSGIGTEATRAGIIDRLQMTDVIVLQKKFLVPTEKAFMMVKVLPEDITYPDTTALWEQGLDDISTQKTSIESFFDQQIKMMNAFLNQAKNAQISAPKDAVICPNCQKPMIRRKGQKGYFWGCSDYPSCKMTAPDQNGKPVFAVKNTYHSKMQRRK